MLTDVVKLWESLKLESSHTGKYLERLVRPDIEVEMVLGKGPERCTFNITGKFAEGWDQQIRVPNCISCTLIGSAGVQQARLELRDEKLEDIFVWFSQDVANRIGKCTPANVAVTLEETLSEWSYAFRLQPRDGMSREAQQGLFAELLFFEEVLSAYSAAENIMAWRSQDSVHDFQLGESAWEVKSFAGRRPEVRISNEEQLDSTGLKELTLAVVRLKVSQDSGASVDQIVERVRQKISHSRAAVLHFQTGLAKYGYIDESSLVTKFFFTPRSLAQYSVTDDFPRIIGGSIPTAIYNVKYVLSLDALEAYLSGSVVEF